MNKNENSVSASIIIWVGDLIDRYTVGVPVSALMKTPLQF